MQIESTIRFNFTAEISTPTSYAVNTPPAKLRFLTESEAKAKSESSQTVLFGAGYLADKTLNLLQHSPRFMVDNNKKKQGTELKGITIKSPDALPEFFSTHEDALLIVCVQKYSEVVEQLNKMNLVDIDRVFITPMAQELGVIDDIREHDSTLLLSNYDAEGGLYLYRIQSGELRKLANGSVRGFAKVGSKIYYVSYTGLHCMDAKRFEHLQSMDLDEYDFCGLVYDEAEGQLILADTQSDRILFVEEETLKVIKDISFGEKNEHFGKECYHVNDMVVVGDYVLASVFSTSGWWRFGLYDGGIIEINRRTGEKNRIPIKECWFPHSITVHDGRLYILDSMNGTLLRDMRDVVYRADGFLRGLEFNGKFCYIGQSLHRHVSRLSDRISVSADTGFHIFNTESRLHRFVTLPELTNIYQIKNVTWL